MDIRDSEVAVAEIIKVDTSALDDGGLRKCLVVGQDLASTEEVRRAVRLEIIGELSPYAKTRRYYKDAPCSERERGDRDEAGLSTADWKDDANLARGSFPRVVVAEPDPGLSLGDAKSGVAFDVRPFREWHLSPPLLELRPFPCELARRADEEARRPRISVPRHLLAVLEPATVLRSPDGR
jgi:hypothetical protein